MKAALRHELENAAHALDDARVALERALRLDDNAFTRDALRLAAGDVDAVRRRVRNMGELARSRAA